MLELLDDMIDEAVIKIFTFRMGPAVTLTLKTPSST